MGIEPMTSSLPRKCSTPELHQQTRAGDEARTRDPNLGRVMLYQLSYSRLYILPEGIIQVIRISVYIPGTIKFKPWGEEESNLRRHKPTDLQSAPFDRSGISPENYVVRRFLIIESITYSKNNYPNRIIILYDPFMRADGGIRTPDQLITNQLLWPTELHRRILGRTV